MELPNLFNDLDRSENDSYTQNVCEYIDSVFSEVRIQPRIPMMNTELYWYSSKQSYDEEKARQYRR